MQSSRASPLLRYIAAVFLVSGIVWVTAVYGERALLQDFVFPLAGTNLDVWLSDFTRASTYGIGVAVIGSLIWYLCTGWILGVRNWRKAGRRWLWFGVGVGTVVVSTVIGIYLVPPLRTGELATYAFFAVNSILVYYLITVFATPPSYKYSPAGATSLRVF